MIDPMVEMAMTTVSVLAIGMALLLARAGGRSR
jgi:hypothetical protein